MRGVSREAQVRPNSMERRGGASKWGEVRWGETLVEGAAWGIPAEVAAGEECAEPFVDGLLHVTGSGGDDGVVLGERGVHGGDVHRRWR
jgi:hypothetical protein